MQEFTAAATQAIRDLALRYGISEDAVRTLLFAVSAGGGAMAQFYHAELGGAGQWMRGGMTMVGDMFNTGLQSRVNGLCTELSSLLGSQNIIAGPVAGHGDAAMAGAPGTGASWWPAGLGSPSASGTQNDTAYAYFADARRLAIREGGRVTVYDTLDHGIGGVQQQQGGPAGSLSFSSQFGTFSVASLPVAAGSTPGAAPAVPGGTPGTAQAVSGSTSSAPPAARAASHGAPRRTAEEILTTIERLVELHRQGVLTDAELQTKKADLLAQL